MRESPDKTSAKTSETRPTFLFIAACMGILCWLCFGFVLVLSIADLEFSWRTLFDLVAFGTGGMSFWKFSKNDP
jgi:hypothetical protein